MDAYPHRHHGAGDRLAQSLLARLSALGHSPLTAVWLLLGAWGGPAASGATNTNAPPPSAAAPGFSFATLREQARALAGQDYKPETRAEIPDSLKNLTYDQYQDIRFRPDQATWYPEKLRFDLECFHLGFLYLDPVHLHVLENGQVRDLPFSPQQFDYGKNPFPKGLTGDVGYAGFRVVNFLSREQRQNRAEVASFIGASYFRLVGLRQRYGSAFRGLAIDTGEASGEEFPRFKEFWIEKPGPEANYLQCYALLDSVSCAGAYRFVLKPGEDTVCEMEASVFVRKGGKKIGLAPLTSMFLVGQNRTRYVPDFRPEVHDADGLLIQTAGGWLWRPLVNPPKTHQITRFPTDNLAGFGLMQRARDFHDYEDLGARYELRPSLWVQPQNNWGTGAVELVEIPSPNEYNDNIVAYWVPQDKPAPGQELRWSCKLAALLAGPDEGAVARVTSTRIRPAHEKVPTRLVVDFTGDCLPLLAAKEALEARVQVSRGEIQHLVTQPNEVTGGWRVFFDLVNFGREAVELRLFLHQAGKPLSETWVYRYEPE